MPPTGHTDVAAGPGYPQQADQAYGGPGGPVVARTPRWAVFAIVAAVVVLVLAAAAVTWYGRRDGRAGGPAHTVTAPLGSAQQSEFQLLSGVTAINVRTADLGADLYRISTPRDSGAVPRVVNGDDRIQLDVVKTEGASSASVDVRLNSRVHWLIHLIGGASAATVDARDGHVRGVDFAGGVTRIELWLPRPEGRVVARMAGGASEYAVHVPNDVPTRVRIGAGAASVSVDGESHSGIAPGSVFAPTGWDQAADRYDIDATAGVATLNVERY
jgi:hypothetical protein